MKYKLEIELELPEGIDEEEFSKLFVEVTDCLELSISSDYESDECCKQAKMAYTKLGHLIDYARGQENG